MVVQRLLTAVASLAEHRLEGAQDLPGGIEPVSPALAGGFFITELPG